MLKHLHMHTLSHTPTHTHTLTHTHTHSLAHKLKCTHSNIHSHSVCLPLMHRCLCSLTSNLSNPVSGLFNSFWPRHFHARIGRRHRSSVVGRRSSVVGRRSTSRRSCFSFFGISLRYFFQRWNDGHQHEQSRIRKIDVAAEMNFF